MAKLKVDTVTNAAGNAAPNFSDGVSIAGTAIASVNTLQYNETTGATPSGTMLGGLWKNTATGEFFMYTGSLGWTAITSTDAAPVWAGNTMFVAGGSPTYQYQSSTNVIEYKSINSSANTTDFGDLSVARISVSGVGGGGRVVMAGGQNTSGGNETVIDYITAATPSNATDFGNLTYGRFKISAGTTGTRAVFEAGHYHSNYGVTVIDYVTILTAANAVDFGDPQYTHIDKGFTSNGVYLHTAGGRGDGAGSMQTHSARVTMATLGSANWSGQLSVARGMSAGVSSETRAVFVAGYGQYNAATNVMDYYTYANNNNAVDFGDLPSGSPYATFSGCSNGTIGTVAGGGPYGANKIRKITIATPSNATEFGTLSVGRRSSCCASA